MEIVWTIISVAAGFGLIGLICKLIGDYLAKKREEAEAQNPFLFAPQERKMHIHYKERKPPSQVDLSKKLLLSYYMDLGEDSVKDMKLDSEFESKRDIIEMKVKCLIDEQESTHGSSFLLADTDNDENAKEIISNIGKKAFAITMFYVFGFENSFPGTPFEKVIEGIVDLLDDNEALDELERSTIDEIFQSAYFEEMIKGKIEERGT